MTLPEFAQPFGTVRACLSHLEAIRWKDGPYCPRCGSLGKIYHYADGQRHRCSDCKRVFRLITGTIFGDSPVKLLPKWFLAIYLETTHSKGLASTQLAKHLGVTQQTAWFMLQRIRTAVAKGGTNGMLGGQVEVDETYIGGKERTSTPGSERLERKDGAQRPRRVPSAYGSGAVTPARFRSGPPRGKTSPP